ncbi:hypothetical protein [Streptomyces neyagawaensis]|uniref:hypothetical protein n=1 Tax=Streptomyces neyagawaensis TaxID=42238 RepID=UPI000AEEDCBA|nr:hypothetical protein [Streptomyces neyagawaensis]MCL6736857.1 hypothetical protein [Streptomyces neyagawaensis]MDE1684622.1 hypothetical protein [Streptomyces neyagawaensis]
MHVENWPKGTQPERSDGDSRDQHRCDVEGGLGTDPFARTGAAGDEVVWPEAVGRTGSVPRPSTAFAGVPRQPDAAGREADRPGTVASPWEQPDQPGRNHDPHEVTVQLDGVGRELDGPGRHPGKDPDKAGQPDGPVFVDESGRRRNRYRKLGIAVGTVCAAYAVVIVGTLVSGNSDAPWLPMPMQKDEAPADKVDTPPQPAESSDVADTAEGVVPPPSAGSVSPGVTPAPGRGDFRGDARDDGKKKAPEASASARPTGGASAGPQPKPTTGVKDPEPSASASQPAGGGSSPTPTPTPTPSESSGPAPGTGSGTDTVAAEGPPTPAPVEPATAAPESPQEPQPSETPA